MDPLIEPVEVADATRPTAQVAAAEVRRLMADGRVEEAQRACDAAILASPAAELYLLNAFLAQQGGRYAQAVDSSRQAARLGLVDWSNALILGDSLRALGDLSGALEALEQAHRLAPMRLDAARAYLDVLARLHGLEAARSAYEADRCARTGGDSEFDAIWVDTATAAAQRLVDDGRLREAEELCRETLIQHPDAGDLNRLLGYLAHLDSRHADVVTFASRAAELGVDEWSNLFFLGRSLAILGDHPAALEALRLAHLKQSGHLELTGSLLEQTVEVEGLDAGAALLKRLADVGQAPEGLTAAWGEIVALAAPSAIRMLLLQKRLEEAEDLCRDALTRYPARRLFQWLGYISAYREWLTFTSAREDRSTRSKRAKISIFLLTYNHGRFVSQALDSILMQETEYEVEINAVDDCSSDDTQSIILDYQSRHPGKIRTFFNKTNIGTLDPPQQKVTYAGYKTLKGDYLAILEGDDYWSSPHKLQRQIDVLESQPQLAACSHNTVKIYEDGSAEPHRFLYWKNDRKVYTIDEAVEMNMFFHTSSIVYRNAMNGNPPIGFRSKWSCDIFFTAQHMAFGEMLHLDEDMSVYRAHAGGAYSTMPALKARIFNIEGLLRYNLWLGWRYAKGYAFALNRLSGALLRETAAGDLPSLGAWRRLRYRAINIGSGALYDTCDRWPGLDPAVWLYGEPPKPSRPRIGRLKANFSKKSD